jgi:hypothetical protein
MPAAARRDCGYLSASDCTLHGCCWTPIESSATAHLTPEQLKHPPQHLLQNGHPWCYVPQSIVGGYVVAAAHAVPASPTQSPGWLLQLKIADGNDYFGADAPMLQVQVMFETKQRLRVRITNPLEERWEIPTSLLPLAPGDPSVTKVDDTYYSFAYTDVPFGFAITRTDDHEVIFNSTAPVGPDGHTPLFNGLVRTRHADTLPLSAWVT